MDDNELKLERARLKFRALDFLKGWGKGSLDPDAAQADKWRQFTLDEHITTAEKIVKWAFDEKEQKDDATSHGNGEVAS